MGLPIKLLNLKEFKIGFCSKKLKSVEVALSIVATDLLKLYRRSLQFKYEESALFLYCLPVVSNAIVSSGKSG